MAYEINGLSLVVLHGEGEHAIGYLSMAERFLEAAEKLVSQEDFLPTAGDPESLLTGHALELLLKSFLLARGMSARELSDRKKFGHDLRKCLKEAEEKGIGKIAPVSPALRGAIAILSREYFGKDLEYYKETGEVVSRPDLRQLLLEIRKVSVALDAVYVDASKVERAQRHRPGR